MRPGKTSLRPINLKTTIKSLRSFFSNFEQARDFIYESPVFDVVNYVSNNDFRDAILEGSRAGSISHWPQSGLPDEQFRLLNA